MKLLLDTHLLIWFAQGNDSLSARGRELIEDAGNEVFFSAVSIWECAIKFNLGRSDFQLHPATLHEELLANDFTELVLYGEEAFNLLELPAIHRDPFDRMLIAQAIAGRMPLLSSDETVLRYPNTLHV